MKLRVTEENPEQASSFPRQVWELTELVMAGCPAEALKEFRKSLIGRGNPLTARQADAAIGGARAVRRTGPLPVSGRQARAELPESRRQAVARSYWYMRSGLPVVFARPEGYKFRKREKQAMKIARQHDIALTFLEWNETGVDRVVGPACLSLSCCLP